MPPFNTASLSAELTEYCRMVRAGEPVRPLGPVIVEKECPGCGREIYAGCDVDCSRVGCGERR